MLGSGHRNESDCKKERRQTLNSGDFCTGEVSVDGRAKERSAPASLGMSPPHSVAQVILSHARRVSAGGREIDLRRLLAAVCVREVV